MPTYLYETIPESPGVEPERFEHWQSMIDAALAHHPETGEPVRRLITGGFAPMGVRKLKVRAAGGGSCDHTGSGPCCG
jgi:hypothetical protein